MNNLRESRGIKCHLFMADYDPAEPSYRFYRDSRQAFGVRFEAPRPNRECLEWLWGVFGAALAVCAVVIMAGQL